MEVGTTVKLKSGGPVMTIDSPADAAQRVKCVWFNKGELQSGLFNLHSLKESESDDNLNIPVVF
ncbi:DUF2158 domain-containing protein [Vibrio neptunius]|uniref:DUF2158 domain-containing protein n=1 Tax=Vibrio neptunius TaxID=170651 RepID=A0ABS3A873_9VIBR|nr:DUF2158 domain-containing protein [Vibrio neptunius]MBN3495887.1 DUF2158 domain-containing protein [Vibrio neptunius]MBN3518288.1 DUF2158 domain-containing protein [Vibrio neptunius]MBN3552636.1 DUF2158 domain-containing protein [Vibrio neptunius]MBN3580691.1 DUF2158 domain-containing protein [Vibrio neptunius]MCH9874357.1 DUF2158 domain-containing protein [Vibrio neptunius]